MFGFRLSKLVVIGQGLESASVDFKLGLNVISGPTDTGKSWLFQCIVFMLGGSDTPLSVKESEGYDRAYLEIIDYSGNTYTLSRALEGGDSEVFFSGYEKIAGSDSKKLKQKKKIKSVPDTISSFLLSLCGLNDKYLSVNKENKKELLTLSTLRPLLFANEVDIIKRKSPLVTDSFFNSTRAKALLKLMLTSQDDSDIVSSENQKIAKATREGGLKILQQLTDGIEEELKALPIIELSSVENEVKQANINLSRALKALNDTDVRRRSVLASVDEFNSRFNNLSEIRKRFDVLKQHYQSDIHRLSFIAEGAMLFDDLQYVACPYCQTPLDRHHRQVVCGIDNQNIEAIQYACRQESAKTQKQLVELQKALKTISDEQEEIAVSIEAKTVEHDEIVFFMNQGIAPDIESIRLRIDFLAVQRSLASERESLNKRLTQIQALRVEPSSSKNDKVEPGKAIEDDAVLSFCEEVKELLISWHVEFEAPITFDEKHDVLDVRLGNELRTNTGKGTRAITYSSFLLGILAHCKKHKYPHSNLVVLDSPLTTYEQPENNVDSNLEDLPNDIQDNVFRQIANAFKNEQVIIIDNKRPPKDALKDIHSVRFTKNRHEGRYGLFPVK